MANAIVGAAEGPWSRNRGMGMQDPFTMMNQMMEYKNRAQQFQANTEFGQLATQYAGDPEGLKNAAMASPNSAYMMENIKGLGDVQLMAAQTNTQKYEAQKFQADTTNVQLNNARDMAVTALRFSGGNLDNFYGYLDALSSKLDPESQKTARPFIDSLKTSAGQGVPSGPGVTQAERNAAFAGNAYRLLISGAQMKPEDASAMLSGWGPTTIQTIGGEPYPAASGLDPMHQGQVMVGGQGGTRILGGGPSMTPGGMPVQPQPQPNQLGGAGITPGGMPTMGGPTAAPTQTTPQTQTQAPTAVPTATGQSTPLQYGQTQSIVPAGQAAAANPPVRAPKVNPFITPKPVAADQAGDGRVLYPSVVPEVGQLREPSIGPSPMTNYWGLGDAERKANDDALKAFEGTKRGYVAAQNNIGSLQLIDGITDDLQRAGAATGNPLDAFLTPGPDLKQRGDLAAQLNTLGTILGFGTPFTSQNVARVQELSKVLQNMSIELAKTTFGGQREAASTIDRIVASLPTMDNTYLGSKVVVATVRSMMQRQIDLNNFVERWRGDLKNHGGTIAGAGEAFNALHPVNDYIDRAMAPLGMDSNLHFRGPNVLGTAKQFVDQGLLSYKQARGILEQQGYSMRPQQQGQ